LYQLVGCLGEVADNDKLARRDMQQSRLNLAAHEAIFKSVVYDVAGGGLHGEDTNVDLFIGARALGFGFRDAEKIATRGGCVAACGGLFQVAILVNIGAFGVEVGELAGEGCVSIVADFFQRRRLDLADDADLVASSDEAASVDRKSVDGDAGGGEPVKMSLGGIYVEDVLAVFLNKAEATATYARHTAFSRVCRQC
jgi:hypothetical protein